LEGSAQLSLSLDRDVLLFFEDRDRDTLIPGDRRLRRLLRKAVAPIRPHKQHITGFEVSAGKLSAALRRAGRTVHVNDFALARRNPHFPIGICGYAHVLDHWSLPNPAVLGPGLFDHPKQRPHLMEDPRYRFYIIRSEWMRELFATVYDRSTLTLWIGGIDVADWPVAQPQEKTTDVLIYDKIRWNREQLVPDFRDRLIAELSSRGLSYEIVRYGGHTIMEYRKLLKRSRSMLFLCESETQGNAYQEALASGLPVLAWDQGTWLDPNRHQWEDRPVAASSVPYFSSECGERFTNVADFSPALSRFVDKMDSYSPRRWVEENLSLRRSAELYLYAYYKAAIGRGVEPRSPA
jgi:hypothetical protein